MDDVEGITEVLGSAVLETVCGALVAKEEAVLLALEANEKEDREETVGSGVKLTVPFPDTLVDELGEKLGLVLASADAEEQALATELAL